MTSRLAKSAGTLVIALLLAGCMMLSDMPPPDVSLIDMRVDNATLLETTAVFTARILNESPEPFVLTGGVFAIKVNGSKIGKGVARTVVEVPALGSVTAEIPVYLSNVSLVFQGMNVMRSEEVRYSLEGTLYVKVGGSANRRVRVVKTGQFKVGAPPPAVPVSVAPAVPVAPTTRPADTASPAAVR